jgi:hypothetical protein
LKAEGAQDQRGGREGRGEMDEGRGKMDEKKTGKIRTVRDLKVYRKAFDCAMEIFEIHCKYIDDETFQRLDDNYEHIFAMLNVMENKVDSFCRPAY